MKLEASSPIRALVVIFALGLLLYLPSFKAPFCFDDQIVIIHNPLIQDISLGWKGLCEVWNFQHSRFLTNLLLALDYALHGLNPFGYHIVNWTIHILTALGVYFFTNLIIKIKNLPKPQLDIGLFTALLFLSHPVNTESVSYISQRSSSLVSLFYLWSTIFYCQGRYMERSRYFVISLFLGLLAILSKETALTLPLAWVMIDYFIIGRRPPLWLGGMLVLMVISVLIFFDFRWKEILFTPVNSQSHRGDVLTPLTYLLTQFRVLVVLFSLISFPASLNLDYDFAMSHSLLEPGVLVSFIFLFILLFTAYRIRKTYWAFSFIIFWFFISLLPHIFPPRGNVIAEHKLYLTLTLFIPIFCCGLYQMIPKKSFVIGLVGAIAVFSGLTFYRNVLWADPVELWKSTAQRSPEKARVFLNLGMAYADHLQFPEAVRSYEKVIRMAPEIPQAYIDLSEIYYRQANRSLSMKYIEQGISVAPEDFLPYVQRGLLFARQNMDDLALNDFNRAIVLNANFREAYKMRGMINLRLHHNSEALSDFSLWLTWHPDDEDILNKRSDLLFQQKSYQAALSDYNHLISINPKSIYYYNRSVLNEILGNQGQMQKDRQMAESLGFKK